MQTGSLPAARALSSVFGPPVAFAFLIAAASALLARLHAGAAWYVVVVMALASAGLVWMLLKPLPRPQYLLPPGATAGTPLRLSWSSPALVPNLIPRPAGTVAAILSDPGNGLFVITALTVQAVALAPLACVLSAGLWPAAAGMWLIRHPLHAPDRLVGAATLLSSGVCLMVAVCFSGGLKALLPVLPLEAAFRVGVLPERLARRRWARGLHAALWTLYALVCSLAVCAAAWQMLRLLPGSKVSRPFAALLIGVAMPWLWLACVGRPSRRPLAPLAVCAVLQCMLAIYLAYTGRLGPLAFWPY